ncbi:16S rRNA (cytosine(967)-C(5))-methyltransferase RsmB [Bdellovibrionota bacterium]
MNDKAISVRTLAASILQKIDKGVPSEDLLEEAFKKHNLIDEDKRLLTELVYGTLRWRLFLDKHLQQTSKRRLFQIDHFVLQVLRVAAYQILRLERIPHYSAVNEAVNSVKRSKQHPAAPFVNGVLRNLVRKVEKGITPSKEPETMSSKSIAEIFSHPLWLVKRWIEQFGENETIAICRANNATPPTTIRVSLLASTRDNLLSQLKQELSPEQIIGPTKASPQGIMLQRTGPVPNVPGFTDGFFVVQDESSQLVTFALDPQPNETILDVCAAPGGKTTHIAERMQNTGKISACDIKKKRLKLIEENAKRMGITNFKIRIHDARKKFFTKFDRVLLDAPCSGSGVIRRYPESKWIRGEEELSKLSKQQLQMIQNAASAVKPGGVLIYSVCSIHPEEGEEVVYNLLDTYKFFEIEDLKNHLPPPAHIHVSEDGFFKSLPTSSGMDGFFIARLRRGK